MHLLYMGIYLQNRAARIITGEFDYIHVRGIDIVKNLKWMNVIQRRDYFVAFSILFQFSFIFRHTYTLAMHNTEVQSKILDSKKTNSNSIHARKNAHRVTTSSVS